MSEIYYEWTSRFGRIVLMRGMATSPKAIYDYQLELKLTANEVWFIMYILSFKWNNNLPYPSISKMEEKSGVSKTTIHKYKNNLVSKGYLKIISRKSQDGGTLSNAYDFSGLFKKLEEFILRDDNKIDNEIISYGVKNLAGVNSKKYKPNTNNSDDFSGINAKKYSKNDSFFNKELNPPSLDSKLPLVGIEATNNNSSNNNKTTTIKNMLLLNFNFKEIKIIELIEKFNHENILKVINFILKNKGIKNKEGFLIKALLNDYQLDTYDINLLQKRENIKKIKNNEYAVEEQKKLFLKYKRKQTEKWKEDNKKLYEELKKQELEKLFKIGIITKPEFTAEINTRVKIWNEYILKSPNR